MKQFISFVLVLLLFLSVMICAFAENSLTDYSDAQLKQLYELVRDEMVKRGLPLGQKITLKEGKFIVGQDDILPETYTITCTANYGDSLGSAYSSLGGLFGGEIGDMMDSLGEMMGDLINTTVEILGDYARYRNPLNWVLETLPGSPLRKAPFFRSPMALAS